MSGALMALLGSGSPQPRITARTISAQETVVDPADAFASAEYALLSTGVAQGTETPGGSTSFTPEWLPSAVGSQWECRFTISSGSPSGTFNTWLALSSDRSFSLTASRTTVGTTANSAQVLVEIRPAGGAVVTSATITLNATATVDL